MRESKYHRLLYEIDHIRQTLGQLVSQAAPQPVSDSEVVADFNEATTDAAVSFADAQQKLLGDVVLRLVEAERRLEELEERQLAAAVERLDEANAAEHKAAASRYVASGSGGGTNEAFTYLGKPEPEAAVPLAECEEPEPEVDASLYVQRYGADPVRLGAAFDNYMDYRAAGDLVPSALHDPLVELAKLLLRLMLGGYDTETLCAKALGGVSEYVRALPIEPLVADRYNDAIPEALHELAAAAVSASAEFAGSVSREDAAAKADADVELARSERELLEAKKLADGLVERTDRWKRFADSPVRFADSPVAHSVLGRQLDIANTTSELVVGIQGALGHGDANAALRVLLCVVAAFVRNQRVEDWGELPEADFEHLRLQIDNVLDAACDQRDVAQMVRDRERRKQEAVEGNEATSAG